MCQNSAMNKNIVIQSFGSVRKTAEALGLTTQAIYAWPDALPIRLADEVRGAMARLGIDAKKKAKK